MTRFLLLLLLNSLLVQFCNALPVVDKGVFVITGVKTCREGYGYCILGTDCTVDKEFIPDDNGGHCEGLKKAFTPRAFFVCCQSLENSTLITPPPPPPPTTTTTTSNPLLSSVEEEDDENNSSTNNNGSNSAESNESVASIESGELGGVSNATAATTESSMHEEVHTEISIHESVHVVLGGVDNGVSKGTTTTTTTTTTTAPTTTTTTTTTTPKTTTTKATTTATTTTTTTPSPPDTCGYKATFYSNNNAVTPNNMMMRIDGSRLAAQQTSLICWTAAIVRSPTSLTLQDPGSFICTGALISEEFLLTTATCVSRLFAQDLSLFKVALGSRHLVHPMNGPTPDATYKDILQLIVHEDYNIQGLFKRVNDVALVRLSTNPSTLRTDEDDFNNHHQKPLATASPYCTVCLPDGEEDHSGEDCIVTGFSHPTGASSSIDDVAGSSSSLSSSSSHDQLANVPSAHDTDGILHEAEQRIEYANNCETQLTNFTVANTIRSDLNIESSKLVCASGKFNAEACFSPRDAGSPLACPSRSNPEQYRLVGVFSSGFHCGTQNSPVLYTDVSKFVGWVKENMRRAATGSGQSNSRRV